MMTTRVVFMGSPDFAVPSLQALINAPDFEVVGVVTQPDRPAGRGGKLRQPPIKAVALAHDISLYQPAKLRGDEAEAQLRAWNADLHVVAAYGQILRPAVLDIPRQGSINVHASVLPRWRGAAPIHAAIRAGDDHTGVTIMLMDEGLDTGDILLSESVPIDPGETTATLHDKLAALGAEILPHALRGYLAGELRPSAQDDTLATYAPQIKKEEGRINWQTPAEAIDRHVRAFHPWPGTFTTWGDKLLKIIKGTALPGNGNAGTVYAGEAPHPVRIGTGAGLYAPLELQLEGKKRLAVQDFVNGNADIISTTLH
ncbi:MAG: methionyl-tRNA formyltransferase [Anaerolineales bacterium]